MKIIAIWKLFLVIFIQYFRIIGGIAALVDLDLKSIRLIYEFKI